MVTRMGSGSGRDEPSAAKRQESDIPGLRVSLVCPECGWLYGKTLHVPSHTYMVKWGGEECPGAGKEGISQRERMEQRRA